MLISKEFKWEAAHRIPWHANKCKNLHGHSYSMHLELEGEVNAQGIVIDFHEMKNMVASLVKAMDHATMVSESDVELLEVLTDKNWKAFVMPYDTTAENLCRYFTDVILQQNRAFLTENGIKKLGIRVFETATSSAYLTTSL